jgi:hypothetical protein
MHLLHNPPPTFLAFASWVGCLRFQRRYMSQSKTTLESETNSTTNATKSDNAITLAGKLTLIPAFTLAMLIPIVNRHSRAQGTESFSRHGSTAGDIFSELEPVALIQLP